MSLKYSCSKSARKYYVTSLFTLLRTQFLSDFLEGIRGSNLGQSSSFFSYHIVFLLTYLSFFRQIVLHTIHILKRTCFCLHFHGKVRLAMCGNFPSFSRSNATDFSSIFTKFSREFSCAYVIPWHLPPSSTIIFTHKWSQFCLVKTIIFLHWFLFKFTSLT